MISIPTAIRQNPRSTGTDPRWLAVATRDRSQDGVFVFAVTTTGIFCRPGCPSRLPLERNVRFFDTIAAAQVAGFRACKRCRPDESSAGAAADAIAKACRLIEASEEMPSLDVLAEAAGLSKFHFHRQFKAALGVTPRAYAAAVRGRRLRDELPQANSVTEAIYAAGYASSSRFYEAEARALGMAPATFRDRGRGEVIRFAFGDTTLGRIVVAATGKGICAILFGSEDAALTAELARRFSNADLIGPDSELAGAVAQVVELIETPKAALRLPLDVRGTAFQSLVWKALQSIPAGHTASYRDVAVAIGKPTAARAVAAACANNAVAVAIPCHRVVHSGGKASGYRWGVERKQELLRREE